jgi:apolipoprotein N-acyltransferase
MRETERCWRDPWMWGLAFWGACVAGFAFSPAGLWPLVLVGPAPLWFSCVREEGSLRARARLGLLRGWFYGAGFFGALLWWIIPTVTRYGGLPLLAGASCLVLLAAYLALYPALGAAAVASAGRRPAGALALAPFLWTGLEGARGWFLSGFPWGDLPQALWQVPWALNLAPWVGIDGVRLLVAACGGAIACLGAAAATPAGSRFRTWWPGLLPLGILAVPAGVLLLLPSPVQPVAGELRVGVVQGNIEQGQKWDPAFREAAVETHRRLTRAVAADGVDLVLWPETALPYYVQTPTVGRAVVERLARDLGISLLFGAPAYELRQGRVEGRNAVFLVDPQGTLSGRYDKVHLVPFGEYIPLGRLFPFLSKLVEGVGDFTSGAGVVPFGARGEIPSLGPLVCFEVIFPGLAAEHLKRGARVLAVVTNDGWFGSTPGPYQHLAFGAWRAAETGLPLVRSANTGVSAVFDERGRLVRSTRLQQEEVFSQRVSYPEPKVTPQVHVRPWISPGSLALALLGLFAIVSSLSERKRTQGAA